MAGCESNGDRSTAVAGNEPETAERLVAGRYRLSKELGRGGMGVVWQAADELIERTVAIKELRVLPGLPQLERDVFVKRALAEARNAARVHHPNAVALHDVLPVTADDDAIYLVMELVRAPTLAQMLAQGGQLSEERVARIGVQLLDVLDAAHELGVVHRDVKPSNVMVDTDDRVKLADFGIAHGIGDSRLTSSGVMGTQAYMAPELFDGASITPAIDLWSLGATLFHAAEGINPFDRETTSATLRAIVLDQPPQARCREPLASAINGLLTRDPGQRMSKQQARPLLDQATTLPPRQVQSNAATTGSHWTSQTTGARPPIGGGPTGFPGGPTGRAPTGPDWHVRQTTATRTPPPATPAGAAPPSVPGSVTFVSKPNAHTRAIVLCIMWILIVFSVLRIIMAFGS